MGGGPPWRHLRSDRSAVETKIERKTLRRVLGFAGPHRRLIAAFLAVTVVDAALVVVPPLLLKAIIDDGVSSGDTSLVVGLAALVALVAPMPGVVPETKALLQGAADRDLDEQRRLEREAQVRRFRAVAAALAG